MAFFTILPMLFLSPSVPTATNADAGRWEYHYLKREKLHKLLYLESGARHGVIYFRCEAAEGWAKVTLASRRGRTRENVLFQSGVYTVSTPIRATHDRASDMLLINTVVPVNHPMLQAMARGAALVVEGASYPVGTEQEKVSVRSFIEACDD
ncbi:MAG: hypothetical protein AVDCRST_MAG93-7318 [uncultured Chloroflexia bacterium]|uniref:Uncharacterized protein n=1 Tax=uncultured Chloroflexia bacterium TaxID=1672391 RepID=A0A6J4MH55_9CHLR|nr:MAG: hypothetical protein AVDCRST_MAG93-7318 [uncultured Chloroflexia bacterium]